MNDKVIEFRGVDMLCIAEVKCDDNSPEAEHIMTISLCLSSALRGLIRSL